jgi:hypothetical protein
VLQGLLPVLELRLVQLAGRNRVKRASARSHSVCQWVSPEPPSPGNVMMSYMNVP